MLQRLKEKGCRITKQRKILIDIILKGECTSCKEIYYKAAEKDSSIGAATVYRMINLMEEIGAISRKNMYRISCGMDCNRENACVIELDDRSTCKKESGFMEDCEYCKNTVDYHEIIDCITCALDARDPYTAGHSERVSDMAFTVCRLLGLTEQDTEKIHIAAHLPDIGKIGVPDAILNKEGKLTEEEFSYIKKHPGIGADILKKSHELGELSDIVLMHHERYDGRGYPLGKKGADIPVGARIIAICDSIDAITSNRCYRKAHDFVYCYQEIEKNLGKMYDPVIGQYVLDNWDEVINVVQSGAQ